MLEGEPRPLHTDRRQQHHLPHARLLRGRQRERVGAVIDRPGIRRHAGARGEAGEQRVEALAPKAVPAQRDGIGDVDEPELDPVRQPGRAPAPVGALRRGPGTHRADRLVAGAQQRPHRRPPGRARRAEHEHAQGCRGVGARSGGGVWRGRVHGLSGARCRRDDRSLTRTIPGCQRFDARAAPARSRPMRHPGSESAGPRRA